MAKQKKNIQEVVQKEYPEFTASVDGLSVDDLNQRLATYAKEDEAVDDAKEADEGLEEAKSRVTELSGPYRDAKKAIKLKMKYLVNLVKEKGGA